MLAHIPNVLTADELATVDQLLALGNYRDGKVSAHGQARDTKQNLEFQYVKGRTSDDRLVEVVTQALARNKDFHAAAFAKIIMPPIFNRYDAGMSYGMHTDAATMQHGNVRIDLSVTVFLSDPESYDGGELVLETPFGTPSVKLAAGDAVVYSTTLRHRVTPVTRGRRIAIVTWIQSLVKGLEQRQILYDLAKARTGIMSRLPRGRETELLLQAQTNLLKMWAEV